MLDLTPMSVRDPARVPCCVSIDVEEYVHVEVARGVVDFNQWDDWPSRVERNVDLLLTLFDACGLRGTFFILGHVAQRHESMVKRIAQAGHEIASHGSNHQRLHQLNTETFRADVLACKKLLEDQTGQHVRGYRAPTFSVVRQTAWAIDVLVELGFEYDASIFPIRHPWYGVPTTPMSPFMVRNGSGPALLEVPPLVYRLGSWNLPAAGGGYFRLLPLVLMQWALAQACRQGRPAILYFHPWEFDPQMPRMPLSVTGRIRTYTGLRRAQSRLECIMRRSSRWSPIGDVLGELRVLADMHPVFDLARCAVTHN